jgi:ATP-dependent RNA helicase SUPV3L1/SUV3
VAEVEPTSSISLLPVAEFAPAEAEPAVAEAVEAAPAPAGDDAVTPPVAADAETKPAEPEMVEVWRPGGHAERRPHRPRQNRRPQQATAADSSAAPVATAETSDASAAPAQDRKDGPNRHQRQEQRQQRTERQAKSFGQPGAKPNQPGGRLGGRPDQRGGRPRRDRGDQVERAEREQYYAKPHGSGFGGGRDKAPDPNSPFAKLAALKQQLEGNKE